jgi:hypothetical protein
VVLIDAAVLEIADHPIAGSFPLTMDQVTDLSYYRPDAFRLDLDHLPDRQRAMIAANRIALQVYAGARAEEVSPGSARRPGDGRRGESREGAGTPLD